MKKVKFSKSSNDISIENSLRFKDCKEEISKKNNIAMSINSFPEKSNCLLCLSPLKGKNFKHRNIEYIKCNNCGHIQTKSEIPFDYPKNFMGQGFEEIYPDLNKKEYNSRVNRIYKPKLNWIIDSLESYFNNFFDPNENYWLEFGCGAGYFLKALVNQKIRKIKGLDVNHDLINVANKNCNGVYAEIVSDICSSLRKDNSNIIVSFFVLEHIENAFEVWDIIKNKKKGTLFIFSVPTFSFTTLLEGAFKDHFPRSLDNVIHTQLYTDQSIEYALSTANYEVISEWVFGQDSQDLFTLIMRNLNKDYAEIKNDFSEKINTLLDPFQEILDKSYFSDARHIIAIKK